MSTLHAHLDESGDLNFSPAGTKHYVFAAAWTYSPSNLAARLSHLRFQLLKDGHDLARFHATEDIALVRNRVTGILRRYTGWHFTAAVIEKAKVRPEFYDPVRFYTHLASMPLRYALRRIRSDTKNVVIYSDHPPSQLERKQRELINKAIRHAANSELPDGVHFVAYHHPSASNA